MEALGLGHAHLCMALLLMDPSRVSNLRPQVCPEPVHILVAFLTWPRGSTAVAGGIPTVHVFQLVAAFECWEEGSCQGRAGVGGCACAS
eukprot:425026-Amphidinium_carterae.1